MQKVGLLLLALLSTSTAMAKDKVLMQRVDVLEGKTAQLEQTLQGRGLVAIMTRLDRLEGEIQQLKGENEEFRHQLKLMQLREDDRYSEINNRLTAEENKQPPSLPPPVVVAPPTEPATPTFPNEGSGKGTSEGTENSETPTAPTANTPPIPVATGEQGDGEAAYQAALQTLRNGEYETAATALSAFPAQYPNSRYLPNAYYWQGEAEYVLNHFDKADIAFQTVIDRFPASNKVADATLKLGFSQQAQGNIDAAKATLTKVIQQYPGTSAARLAQSKLDNIGQ